MYLFYTYQSDHLSRLANNLEIFEALQDEGNVERADGHHVNYIHCFSQEPKHQNSTFDIALDAHLNA